MGILAARSLLYSFVSALFSSPASEKFELLRTAELQHGVRASSRYLEEHPTLLAKNLDSLAKEIFAAISNGSEAIQTEYTKVFGHTLSKDTSPYELEHLKSKEVFSLTQALADINGFYKAFGLEVDAGERADHVAIEAEFLSYLILKETIASEADQAENAEVCRNAQRDFWKDHFFWWTDGFSNRLWKDPNTEFYRLASQYLSSFLETEQKFLGA